MKNIFIAILLTVCCTTAWTQRQTDGPSWKKISSGMPDTWYGTDDARRIADTIVRYQTAIGGWPKNVKWNKDIDRREMAQVRRTGIGATIDNGATTMEMHFLARVYSQTHAESYREAFIKGIDYLLKAQYENGGWPQFYPVRPQRGGHYSGHITYNDGAMLNTMCILADVYNGNNPHISSLNIADSIRSRAKEAFDRGVDCILKTQIRVNGTPTVWCAQHDSVTLKPAGARAYELPSFSGAESVGLVWLLMSLPEPSQEVITAVKGAVKWLDDHRIDNHKFVRRGWKTGITDATLIPMEGSTEWARFYDLETGKPFFCDRDGIKRNSLEEVGSERRNGYGWYTEAPAGVIKAYPDWCRKHGISTM